MQPLVSVVVPFYQQDEFLAEAVASALAQTYPNLEIIVVDDCSPGTPAAELLGPPSHRVTVIRHQEQLGVSAARNTAVAHSSGQLILPLDADDRIAADYLELTVPYLIADPELGAVFTSAQQFGQEDSIWVPEFTLAYLLCNGCPNTFLYRRQLFDTIGGYNRNLNLGENTDFWLEATSMGWRHHYLNRPLYHYRKHAQAKTSSDGFTLARAYGLLAENRELCVSHLDEILLEHTRRLHEQFDRHELLYAQYLELHSTVQQQYAELSKLSPADGTPGNGFVGAVRSFFSGLTGR